MPILGNKAMYKSVLMTMNFNFIGDIKINADSLCEKDDDWISASTAKIITRICSLFHWQNKARFAVVRDAYVACRVSSANLSHGDHKCLPAS